jgi:hypothetical protein
MTIIRGVTFRDYDVCGLENTEVSLEDGVIAYRLPDEIKTHYQALAIAEMFRRAANELPRVAAYVDDGA